MKRLTCLTLFLLLAGVTARADLSRGDNKESLRGLNGIYVVAQIVNQQIDGVATNDILALAKTELLNASIPVNGVPNKGNGNANLSITVAAIKQPQLGVYVFTVEVAVTQDVQLARQPGLKGISAETWRRTTQGITVPDRIDVIQKTLKQIVDMFVADYRTVNPGTGH
ncbi:MAG TPA: hypothetical protein VH251_05035 [Verrucomicrobiae bacterium]|nr:hypothetical protein [Verrucomicrobiae bacterium]